MIYKFIYLFDNRGAAAEFFSKNLDAKYRKNTFSKKITEINIFQTIASCTLQGKRFLGDGVVVMVVKE